MPFRVYAVIPRSGRAVGRGLEREPLRVIRSGSFALVVGKAGATTQPDRVHLLRYDRVVRRLATGVSAILPARFGSVVDDEAELRALASSRRAELHDALRLVSGREQMTLRFRFPQGRIVPVVEAARLPAGRKLSGRQYLDSRAAALRPPHTPELDKVRMDLAGLVCAERSPGRHEADEVVLYHLIDRGAARSYRWALRDVAKVLPQIHVSASGPFPPYAFAPGLWR